MSFIIVVLILLLVATVSAGFMERFSSDTVYTIANCIVCAYYDFRHDPNLDLSRRTIFELYKLEWRNKTARYGLPYVYEYLFFDMHHYIQFKARQGKSTKYIDLVNFVVPFVDEIYRKNKRFFPQHYKIEPSCNLSEIVDDILIWRQQDFDDQAIYNVNSARFLRGPRREILPNNRAGNNTREGWP